MLNIGMNSFRLAAFLIFILWNIKKFPFCILQKTKRSGWPDAASTI